MDGLEALVRELQQQAGLAHACMAKNDRDSSASRCLGSLEWLGMAPGVQQQEGLGTPVSPMMMYLKRYLHNKRTMLSSRNDSVSESDAIQQLRSETRKTGKCRVSRIRHRLARQSEGIFV